jgi:hypothetical protein
MDYDDDDDGNIWRRVEFFSGIFFSIQKNLIEDFKLSRINSNIFCEF